MSKAIKKVFKAVKKAVKWVAKNIIPILAVAALVFTGGAALGFFQGAGSAGATGMTGIKAAWGGLFNAGTAVGTETLAGATPVVESGATLSATAADAIGVSAMPAAEAGAGIMAPISMPAALPQYGATINTGLNAGAGAQALNAAGAAGKAVGGFVSTPGGGIATAVGLQAGGAYMQGRAAEQAEKEARERYNNETYMYGVNRNGVKYDGYTGGEWQDVMAPPPPGLMAPTSSGPAPRTIDELIQARAQGQA